MLTEKRKWIMPAAGTVSFLAIGLMYAWSVVKTALGPLFPNFTATRLSFCFTLTIAFFCFGGLFSGRIAARVQPRFSLRLAALLLLAGYVGASFMPLSRPGLALLMLYVFYAVLVGFGTGVTFNTLTVNITPWFPAHIGLCAGVMMMGFGLSSLIYAFVIGRLLTRFSVFALLRIFAVLIFTVLFLTSFVLKRPPVSRNETETAHETGSSCTSAQMLSRPSFWVYFFWNTITGGAGLMIINSAANIASYFGLIASLGMIVSVFNGCGRPLVGAMADRLGQYGSMLVVSLMLTVSAAFLIFADRGAGSWMMFGGMLFVGIVYGGGSTINIKVIRDAYGPKHYAANHAISNFSMITGSLAGPLVSGILQDREAGGFTGTFLVLFLMGVLSFLLSFILRLCLNFENRT